MVVNPLPPQAYTKDMLVKAYQWLQNQPESIKEIALTPDMLVSLYTKAQMQGDQVLERPSIQNFKHELKNLAGLMTDLKEPTLPAPSLLLTDAKDSSPSALMIGFPVQHASVPNPNTPAANAAAARRPLSAGHGLDLDLLDAKSREMILDSKSRMNLSSDGETLRLLISLGYSKIKNL